MKDCILRVTGGNQQVRLFVAITTEMVDKARAIHGLSPLATAALGRTLTATAIMGSMMKGDKDLITLQIKGDGPIGTVLATSDACARVKGYVGNPLVDLPPKANGKFDVAGAVGKGLLNILMDIGMKEPYNGQIELVSGEIAEDLTYYFASSQQTPSVVALGVLAGRETMVKQSGGFIMQLLPSASDDVISQLEENVSGLKSMTQMLEDGLSAEDIAGILMTGLDYDIKEIKEPKYECDCSRERVQSALMTVGVQEIQQMINDNETIDMSCHFCNTHYEFEIEDLKEILQLVKKP